MLGLLQRFVILQYIVHMLDACYPALPEKKLRACCSLLHTVQFTSCVFFKKDPVQQNLVSTNTAPESNHK